MAYVVAATWRAREGEEERIREILERIAPLCRDEPACRLYQYDDEAGFQAHTESEHFETHVRGDAVPRLESRERAIYVTLD